MVINKHWNCNWDIGRNSYMLFQATIWEKSIENLFSTSIISKNCCTFFIIKTFAFAVVMQTLPFLAVAFLSHSSLPPSSLYISNSWDDCIINFWHISFNKKSSDACVSSHIYSAPCDRVEKQAGMSQYLMTTFSLLPDSFWALVTETWQSPWWRMKCFHRGIFYSCSQCNSNLSTYIQ